MDGGGAEATVKVLIGGLIHDRGQITDCYLRHLRELDVSGMEVRWFFIGDGLCPELEEWLYDTRGCTREEGERNQLIQSTLGRGAWIHVNDDGPHWSRSRVKRDDVEGRPEFRRLAFLRNILRERAIMEDVDALISIDSDICVPPDLVQRFAETGKPWVSALVDNSARRDGNGDQELVRMGGGERTYNHPCYNICERDPATRRILPDFVNGGEAWATGAVCFYSRELLGRAHWVWDKGGEDFGFSDMAKTAGYRARYLPVVCDHLMTPERLAAHMETCALCQD